MRSVLAAPHGSFAPAALYEAAAVQQRMGTIDQAIATYLSVGQTYPSAPAAKQAAAALEKLANDTTNPTNADAAQGAGTIAEAGRGIIHRR